MESFKKNVIKIMEKLEKLSNDDYSAFELALALFLRADVDVAKKLKDKEIKELDIEIFNSEYFMSDDLRDYIDSVLEKY